MRSSKSLISAILISSTLFIAWGVYSSFHSDLFSVQVVEVVGMDEKSPVDADEILKLASVETGKENLFNLSLKKIEDRILSHPWIKNVEIQKRFPHSIQILPEFKEAKGFAQNLNGELGYVDDTGHIYGKVKMLKAQDLPLFSGFYQRPDKLKDALAFIEQWNETPLKDLAPISGVSYDPERGYRAIVSYPLLGSYAASEGKKSRTFVHLGSSLDQDLDMYFQKLKSTFEYLSYKGLSTRQVWADVGKKVIVKLNGDGG